MSYVQPCQTGTSRSLDTGHGHTILPRKVATLSMATGSTNFVLEMYRSLNLLLNIRGQEASHERSTAAEMGSFCSSCTEWRCCCHRSPAVYCEMIPVDGGDIGRLCDDSIELKAQSK